MIALGVTAVLSFGCSPQGDGGFDLVLAEEMADVETLATGDRTQRVESDHPTFSSVMQVYVPRSGYTPDDVVDELAVHALRDGWDETDGERFYSSKDLGEDMVLVLSVLVIDDSGEVVMMVGDASVLASHTSSLDADS